MAVREILKLGEPLLRLRCQAVEDPAAESVAEIASDLRDTLEVTWLRTTYGRGIAAPQIGVPLRIVYLSSRVLGQELVLVNPHVLERSERLVTVWDSCLSFLDIFMRVERHEQVTIEYADLTGKHHTLVAGVEHDLAELLQHELDHLDGILCLDRVKNSNDIVSREYFEKNFRQDSPYAKTEA